MASTCHGRTASGGSCGRFLYRCTKCGSSGCNRNSCQNDLFSDGRCSKCGNIGKQMLSDSAYEEVNQEFSIRRETLGGGQGGRHWQQYKSANKAYQLNDFLERDGRPKFSLAQMAAVFLIGLIFSICLLVSDSSGFLSSKSEIWIAQWSVTQSTAILSGLILSFTAALSFVVYSLQRKAVKVWDDADRWKYVAPGWGVCHFTFGNSGIGVDGNYFLFFLEWEAVKYVRKTSDKIELQNQDGQILAIPKRFFAPDEGGDISWDEVEQYIRKSAPQAEWY
mgnify:CR=1 FL=1